MLLDLREADTGVYSLSIDYGLFQESGGGWVDGGFQNDRQLLAVVNEVESPFGAGWSIDGWQRLYIGDEAVLLVDGNGTEQIFVPPATAGEAFTALSLDRSELRQEPDGSYIRRLIDGTEQEFDAEGLLRIVRDRNGNETEYAYNDDNKITEITDPVGLKTRFSYRGELVAQITDPAGRVSTLSYDGKNLTAITDADGSRRAFTYDPVIVDDPLVDPYEHLITGQTHKRGNASNEPLPDEFEETIEYGDFGRVEGGERIDGRNFRLEPAQLFAANLPKKDKRHRGFTRVGGFAWPSTARPACSGGASPMWLANGSDGRKFLYRNRVVYRLPW